MLHFFPQNFVLTIAETLKQAMCVATKSLGGSPLYVSALCNLSGNQSRSFAVIRILTCDCDGGVEPKIIFVLCVEHSYHSLVLCHRLLVGSYTEGNSLAPWHPKTSQEAAPLTVEIQI